MADATQVPAAPVEMIRYVGSRATRADNICGTKIVWRGEGDVQPVPAPVAKRLLKHSDVWRLASEPWEPRPAAVQAILRGDLSWQVLEAARAGDWDRVAEIDPQMYASAERYWCVRTENKATAPEAPIAPAQDGVQAWADALLAGNVRQVKARLIEHRDILRRAPELCEVLGQIEATHGNRRSVLDLIEEAEALALSPQEGFEIGLAADAQG